MILSRYPFIARIKSYDFFYKTNDRAQPCDLLVCPPGDRVGLVQVPFIDFFNSLGPLRYHVPWWKRGDSSCLYFLDEAGRPVEYKLDRAIRERFQDNFKEIVNKPIVYWHDHLYFLSFTYFSLNIGRYHLPSQRIDSCVIDSFFGDLRCYPIWGGDNKLVFVVNRLSGLFLLDEKAITLLLTNFTFVPSIRSTIFSVVPILDTPIRALVMAFYYSDLTQETVLEDVYYIPDVDGTTAYRPSEPIFRQFWSHRAVRDRIGLFVFKDGQIYQCFVFGGSRAPYLIPVFDYGAIYYTDLARISWYAFCLDTKSFSLLDPQEVGLWFKPCDEWVSVCDEANFHALNSTALTETIPLPAHKVQYELCWKREEGET